MTKILHISNTCIFNDSRIRKELNALSFLPKVELHVIGTPEVLVNDEKYIDCSRYWPLILRSRLLTRLPRVIRYIFELIEFTVLAFLHGRRIKAEVIHCHDTMALPTGWLLKTLGAAKLIYDAHELESNKNGQNIFLSKATLMIERCCWPQVDLLVSVSDSIITWYMKHFDIKHSVLVLNSPVQTPSSSSLKLNTKDRYFHNLYEIPSDELIFLYLGILGPGRGIESYIEAFSNESSKAHVIFIGFGAYQEKIRLLSSTRRNIHLHPPVPHDQIVSLASHADYGLCLIENVSLSDYYCLPNKLFEYCFAGLPVLASKFPEIENIVEKYSLGICCECEPNSIKEALSTIIRNRPRFRGIDISDLSWETQAERLRDAYKSKILIGQ